MPSTTGRDESRREHGAPTQEYKDGVVARYFQAEVTHCFSSPCREWAIRSAALAHGPCRPQGAARTQQRGSSMILKVFLMLKSTALSGVENQEWRSDPPRSSKLVKSAARSIGECKLRSIMAASLLPAVTRAPCLLRLIALRSAVSRCRRRPIVRRQVLALNLDRATHRLGHGDQSQHEKFP
jgi:hypothetical protein